MKISALTRKRLIAAAVSARRKAYCPYTRYAVGAAVLTRAGRIFTGCNVENSSLGLSLCAERVALHNAVSQGGGPVAALAVACVLALPCGACRQVLSEFAPPQTPVFLVHLDARQKRVQDLRLSQLLPLPFNARGARLIRGEKR